MSAAPASPAPVRLALVEDRAEVRQLLVERLGFFDEVEVVLAVGTAESFLERLAALAEDQRPRVVLMDIELPGMDGVTATAQLDAGMSIADIVAERVAKTNGLISAKPATVGASNSVDSGKRTRSS